MGLIMNKVESMKTVKKKKKKKGLWDLTNGEVKPISTKHKG